ncbi:MAG: D-tagatose-bisphosphate aldolase, class non-catalytic subunit, partial [Mycobacterium sp.]|nr:D-tagatose-bisphosphate aldolase, class non-catalytic subunit [Mycobacterium sp.]
TYWQGYYDGDVNGGDNKGGDNNAGAQRTARRYSYSDRLRYYWPDPEIEAARQTLLTNLSRTAIPMPLISQFLPDQYHRIRAGLLDTDPRSLVIDKVRDALRPYAHACSTTGEAR